MFKCGKQKRLLMKVSLFFKEIEMGRIENNSHMLKITCCVVC